MCNEARNSLWYAGHSGKSPIFNATFSEGQEAMMPWHSINVLSHGKNISDSHSVQTFLFITLSAGMSLTVTGKERGKDNCGEENGRSQITAWWTTKMPLNFPLSHRWLPHSWLKGLREKIFHLPQKHGWSQNSNGCDWKERNEIQLNSSVEKVNSQSDLVVGALHPVIFLEWGHGSLTSNWSLPQSSVF